MAFRGKRCGVQAPRRHVRRHFRRVGSLVGRRRRADDAVARPEGNAHPYRPTEAAVITPRVTRLVRVASPQAFREAAISLATQGSPLDARARLVIVPTYAAAEQLVRGIENARPAVILPDFATAPEFVRRLADPLARPPPGPR